VSTLLLVHAHPDDESIMTGGVMARAHDAGHRVVLVTATRGEEGEIHNVDEASTRPRLAEVRSEELRRAAEILGVDRQVFLGYRDSGMAGTPANDNSDSFHRADVGDAAMRLSRILTEERPDVVVTYDPGGTYGHPDHKKAHQVTFAALDLMLLQGGGWRPRKAYMHGFPRQAAADLFNRLRESGFEMPAQQGQQQPAEFGVDDAEITTVVDVRDLIERKRAAFAAHVTQNDPNSFFFHVPPEFYEAFFGTETFILARGELGGRPESDLFD
jgi:N-acetyl-1-D-myo-inositol-2-amino-2-deoxy-alpha-D-glucopyranoside deacetylase